jgi:hypothetical protein
LNRLTNINSTELKKTREKRKSGNSFIGITGIDGRLREGRQREKLLIARVSFW